MTWKVSNRAYFKIIIMPYYCYSYHMSTRILPSQFAQSTNISKPYQCCTVWEYADYQLWRTRKDSIYQGEEVYLWYDIKRLSSLWKLLWMWRSVFLNINIYCKKKSLVFLFTGDKHGRELSQIHTTLPRDIKLSWNKTRRNQK